FFRKGAERRSIRSIGLLAQRTQGGLVERVAETCRAVVDERLVGISTPLSHVGTQAGEQLLSLLRVELKLLPPDVPELVHGEHTPRGKTRRHEEPLPGESSGDELRDVERGTPPIVITITLFELARAHAKRAVAPKLEHIRARTDG